MGDNSTVSLALEIDATQAKGELDSLAAGFGTLHSIGSNVTAFGPNDVLILRSDYPLPEEEADKIAKRITAAIEEAGGKAPVILPLDRSLSLEVLSPVSAT